MSKWVRVASVDECPPGMALERVADGRIIALFHVDGRFYAMDGICPHQGGPLGKGSLSGCLITCPWHGWQYDVTSGRHQTNASIRHPCFAVKVEQSEVLVQLEE